MPYRDDKVKRERSKKYYLKNKRRILARNRRWAEKNKEKVLEYRRRSSRKYRLTRPSDYKAYRILYRYGITIDEYNSLLRVQKRKCAICGLSEKRAKAYSRGLYIDHNHKTGKVRGLLCLKCNMGVGSFDDNVRTLRKVIKYLQ